MNKYTDGYYIYRDVEFTCHLDLKECDGCNRTLIGFVYALVIQGVFKDQVTYCAECMQYLEPVSVS